MKKLMGACFLLLAISIMQSQVFAADLNCEFKDDVVEGVKTIVVTNETLKINRDLEIPLEKSSIRCGNFGKQTRFDGSALGYQVVLESCTEGVAMRGALIDSVKGIAANVICNKIETVQK
jgi:hypothetical protein